MRTRVGLIPNPDREQKKQEQEHDKWKTKIQQNFITRMKQKHNKVVIRKHTQKRCWIN
jgi:hypothetical protein